MHRAKKMALAGFLIASPVFAASADTPPARPTDSIYACTAISDDVARLKCFDTATAELKAAESSGQVRTIDVAAIEKIERESFGFTLPSLADVFRRGDRDGSDKSVADKQIDEVTLPIKSISVNRVTRKATVTLENGQVWEQIDSQEIPGNKVRKGKQATIKRASLGSFLMTIDGGAGIRVKRVN